VCIQRLALPKEFLNDNNDSNLTMLGGRLFQTLIIRSLKMFSHINTTMVDEQFVWVPARVVVLWPAIHQLIFTALHVMQTRYCEEISVRLSVRPYVRPSIARVHCDKTVERSVQIYIPYERTFIPLF